MGKTSYAHLTATSESAGLIVNYWGERMFREDSPDYTLLQMDHGGKLLQMDRRGKRVLTLNRRGKGASNETLGELTINFLLYTFLPLIKIKLKCFYLKLFNSQLIHKHI